MRNDAGPLAFLKLVLPGVDHLLWECRADWYVRTFGCLCVSGTTFYGIWTGQMEANRKHLGSILLNGIGLLLGCQIGDSGN